MKLILLVFQKVLCLGESAIVQGIDVPLFSGSIEVMNPKKKIIVNETLRTIANGIVPCPECQFYIVKSGYVTGEASCMDK